GTVQECAQPERGATVPMLLLYARMPATDRRFRRVAVDASPGQGQARAQAVPRHQDHEGGSGRRRKDERGDQGALQQTVRGVKPPRLNLRGTMSGIRFSRRDLLTASTAAAAGVLASHAGELMRPARAQTRATAAEPITPALVEAAKRRASLPSIPRWICRSRRS